MTSNVDQQDHLNGHSGFIFAVFCVVSVCVIWPFKLPLPSSLQRWLLLALLKARVIGLDDHKSLSTRKLHVVISLTTAPIIAVLLGLATTTINGSTIRLGIVGDGTTRPYDVLVLFICLAYISIALDGTGALEAMAFYVSKRGGSSGRLLFTYLYLFFFLLACIVGNDPLILSGTPFIAYLTHHAGLESTAWIFSEFHAANTASAVLVSSNPTNILITGSFGLNYLTDFTKWTVLPSVICAALNYFILLTMFWNRIPKILTPMTDDPWSKLRHRNGAIFFSTLMVATIAVLVGTSFVPGHAVDVWMVTAPAGILAFLFNVVSDLVSQSTEHHAKQEAEMHAVDLPTPHSPIPQAPKRLHTIPSSADASPSLAAKVNTLTSHPMTLMSLLRLLLRRFPSTSRTVRRLPIALLPFAMCEFILVRGIEQHGWISVFASGFANACTTPVKTVFFYGFISAAFLCPLAGTNIGATILLVEIIRNPSFSQSAAVSQDRRIFLGAVYSVALGSNIGAFSYPLVGEE